MFASQQFRSPGAMGGFPPAGRWRGLGLPSLKLTALAPEKIAFPQKEMHLPSSEFQGNWWECNPVKQLDLEILPKICRVWAILFNQWNLKELHLILPQHKSSPTCLSTKIRHGWVSCYKGSCSIPLLWIQITPNKCQKWWGNHSSIHKPQ